MSKSQILFITICSRHKDETQGSAFSTFSDTIVSQLDEIQSNKLINTRFAIKSALPTIKWQNVDLSELSINDHLFNGPDFGGNDNQARYLPAYQRYTGNFFERSSLRTEGMEQIEMKGYHLLILSGLYGIVSAKDPIQLYSCPIEPESIDIQTIWRNSCAITDCITNYCITNGIRRVFDLTMRDIYRDLVDWDTIKIRTNTEILHCYHKEAAGDKAIREFGTFFKEFLLTKTEVELLELPIDSPIKTKIGHFIFAQQIRSPDGWPKDDSSVIRHNLPNPLLECISYYQQAVNEHKSIHRMLASGKTQQEMNASLQTAASKTKNAFEKTIRTYTGQESEKLFNLINEMKNNPEIPISLLDSDRFESYRKIVRNAEAHTNIPYFEEIGGCIRFTRNLMILYLKINPNHLPELDYTLSHSE